MRDLIIEHHVHKDRDCFIKAIDEEAIRRLASSYHKNDPCKIFKPSLRGSYNVCFFVQFSPWAKEGGEGTGDRKGDRWVVRIPLSPCLAFVDEKLEVEIATMRHIAEKTTIPIPRIHGYSFLQGSPIGMAFLIMDYAEGRTLHDIGLHTLSANQRSSLYSQLAAIFIQLRLHEFPHSGSLSLDPNGTIHVRKRPLSVDVNSQELEGLRPMRIFNSAKDAGIYTSANEYISSLLCLGFNAFKESRTSVFDEEDGGEALYNLYQFQNFVQKSWLNPALDSGPFVLMHGDLRPPNLLMNEDLDIIAVIDWEWSRVVPLQLFVPPTWLTGREVGSLCWFINYEQYIEELNKFRSILSEQEKLYSGRPLSREWAKIEEKGAILISSALQNPSQIDDVCSRYLDGKLYRHADRELRVKEFMNGNAAHQTLVKRKVGDRQAYQEELKLYGIADPDDNDGAELFWTATYLKWEWFKRLAANSKKLFKSQSSPQRVVVLVLVGTTYLIGRRIFNRCIVSR